MTTIIVVDRKELYNVLKALLLVCTGNNNIRLVTKDTTLLLVSNQDFGFVIGKVNILEKNEDLDASVVLNDIVPCISVLKIKNIEIKIEAENILIINKEEENCYKINKVAHSTKVPNFTSRLLMKDVSGQDLIKLSYVCNKANNIDQFNKVVFASNGMFAYSYTMGMLIESKCSDSKKDLAINESEIALAGKVLKSIKKSAYVYAAKEVVYSKDDFLDSLINGAELLGEKASAEDNEEAPEYILLDNSNISLYLKAEFSNIPNISTIMQNINRDVEFSIDKDAIDDIFKKHKDLKFGNANSVMILRGFNIDALEIGIISPDQTRTSDFIKIDCNTELSANINIALNARDLKSLLLKEDGVPTCQIDIKNGMFVTNINNKKIILAKMPEKAWQK